MLQLNSKTLKNFRDIIAKWHIADFDCADEKITKATVIKNYDSLIASNEALIEKIKDSNPAEVAKRTAEIAEFRAKQEAEKERVKKHLEAQKPNLEAGRALVTEELVNALSAYLENVYDDKKEAEVLEQIVKFFINNGAEGVTTDDVRKYLRPIGRRNASARQKCKTGKHTTTLKTTDMKDIFLGGLCDDPAFIALLPVYSWTNKIEKKSKKQK